MMARIGQDSGYGWEQPSLLVAQDGENRPRQLAQRVKKGLEGGLVEPVQPPAAQGQPSQKFADEPQLRFATFWGQAVEGDDQPAVLFSCLSQVIPVLSFVTGQQRQIDLPVEIAYVGLRNLNLGCEVGPNISVDFSSFLAQPPNAGQDIVVIGGAGESDPLPFRRQEPRVVLRTRRIGAVSGPAGNG